MQFSAIKWFKNSSGELVAPLLISSCLLLVIVSALANHSDSDSKSYILAAQNIQYLKDANNEFTIEEIVLRQSKFTASEGIMNFGFINHSYWFKIDISKLHLTVPVDETLYYLKLAYPSVNLATLYYQTSNGSWSNQQAGTDIPHADWPYRNRNIIFPFDTAEVSLPVLYLRLQSNHALSIALEIIPQKEFTHAEAMPVSLWGGYYAALGFICIFSLFVYLTTRYPPYAFYCGYALFTGLFFSVNSGLGYEYLWPANPAWNIKLSAILPCLMVIMAIGFIRGLLNTASHSKSMDKALNYCGWAHIGFLPIALLVNYDLRSTIFLTSQLTCIIILATAIQLLTMSRAATFFVTGWGFFIAGGWIFGLAQQGVLPINNFTWYVREFGSAPQLLLLSFALASRIRQTVQDKNNAIVEKRLALDQTNIALKTANRVLEDSVSTKNEFLTTISHELRTPLNGIMGSIEMMQQLKQSAQMKSFLDISDRCSKDMLNLIENILDLSEARSGHLQLQIAPLNLVESLKNLSNYHEKTAKEKSLHYTIIIGENVPKYVRCDSHRVFQVLDQIIGNALKFTESGSVNFVVTKHEEGSCDEYSILHFCITDTGIGIVPEKVSTLFEPFSSADTSMSRGYDGLGIGLALSYRLLKSMGGDLKFTTINRRGSIFEVTLKLPSCEDGPTLQWDVVTPVAEPESKPTAKMDKRKNQRILIVDDNPSNILILKALVTKLGYSVETAANGELAVKYVEEHPTDLILMDCQMPVMDGYEATRCIREFSKGKNEIPIVAVTANAMSTDKEKCLDAGMDDYIPKPVKKNTLEEKIDLWMHKKDDFDNSKVMH